MKNPIMEYIRLVRAIQQARREGRSDELMQKAKASMELQRNLTRPARYEMIDGSAEIGWGAAQICFAISGYSVIFLSDGRWKSCVGMFFLICACVAMPVSRWCIKRFVTWPRTGYAARRRDRVFWGSIIGGGVVAAAFSLIMVWMMQPEMKQAVHSQIQAQIHHSVAPQPGVLTHHGQVFLAIYIVSNAMLYLMMSAVTIGKYWWKWLVLALIIFGSIAAALQAAGSFVERMRPLGLLMGLVWLVSGAIVLTLYVRQHPSHLASPE